MRRWCTVVLALFSFAASAQLPREVVTAQQSVDDFFQTGLWQGFGFAGKFHFEKHFRARTLSAEPGKPPQVEIIPWERPMICDVDVLWVTKDHATKVQYRPVKFDLVFDGLLCAKQCTIFGDGKGELVQSDAKEFKPWYATSGNYQTPITTGECRIIDPARLYADFLKPKWVVEKDLKRPANRPLVGPFVARDSEDHGVRKVVVRTEIRKTEAGPDAPAYLAREVTYDSSQGWMPTLVEDEGNGIKDVAVTIRWDKISQGDDTRWLPAQVEQTFYRQSDGNRVLNQQFRLDITPLSQRWGDRVTAFEVAKPIYPDGEVKVISDVHRSPATPSSLPAK